MKKQLRSIAGMMLLAVSALAGVASAAPGSISVHVLNQQTGMPARGMRVDVAKAQGDHWATLGEGVTDVDGRIAALHPKDPVLEQGRYRIRFQTGSWYRSRDAATFYPEVDVVIEVDGSVPHYHVPLLLSPYGFTTYRGS